MTGEYEAVLFGGPPSAAYALFRRDGDSIHLRQFFVERESRRKDIGSTAFAILTREIWPVGIRITIDVLIDNDAGRAFWAHLGFREYALTMQLVPVAEVATRVDAAKRPDAAEERRGERDATRR
ncbi:MAG TPA: GNAT family N-acetyltransferase [Thermoanaerobaculia bacterium]|nr:GNAT family N-acetyltransferase [Thermoanaerobaculia bacterium]